MSARDDPDHVPVPSGTAGTGRGRPGSWQGRSANHFNRLLHLFSISPEQHKYAVADSMSVNQRRSFQYLNPTATGPSTLDGPLHHRTRCRRTARDSRPRPWPGSLPRPAWQDASAPSRIRRDCFRESCYISRWCDCDPVKRHRLRMRLRCSHDLPQDPAPSWTHIRGNVSCSGCRKTCAVSGNRKGNRMDNHGWT